jgi:microcystin-dependent protein
MTNPYFNNSIDLTAGTRARASDVEANFTAVGTGFDGVRADIQVLADATGGAVVAAESVVPSANVLNLVSTSSFLSVTGTTTIASFGTTYTGAKFVRFAGVLTLSHSASLVLPGAVDITTVAGDTCVATPIGTPAVGWRISDYRRMAKPLIEDDAMRLSAAVAARTAMSAAPLTGEGTSGSWPISVTGNGLPAGALIDFAGTTAPSGFLLCDGSSYSTTTYAALYAALGGAASPWGVGAGTFNVPDLRRRTTIGAGGTAVSGPANTVGSVGGAETNTTVPSHTHVLAGADASTSNFDGNHTHSDPSHMHTAGAYVGGGLNASTATIPGSPYGGAWQTDYSGTGMGYMNSNNNHTHTLTGSTAATGAASVTNMPPAAVVTKIIKV